MLLALLILAALGAGAVILYHHFKKEPAQTVANVANAAGQAEAVVETVVGDVKKAVSKPGEPPVAQP